MKTSSAPTFLKTSGPGVVGLNQSDEGIPWHHYLNLRQELLAFCLLLGGRLLVVREVELRVPDESSACLRSQSLSREEWQDFPESL